MINKKERLLIGGVLLAALLVIAGIVLFSGLKPKGETRLSLPFQSTDKTQLKKLVVLGSSMAKANNLSTKLVGDHPEYSFASGTKIESLYLYLKNKGEQIEVVNLAESGANSRKVLERQVPQAVSFNPQYVVLDIMADLLEEKGETDFEQNLSEIVAKIKTEKVMVLIGTYPNLVVMRKASYKACKEDKLHLGVDKVTEERIETFNQVISKIAGQYELILVDNFETIGPEEVSDYDCLHPNISGQEKLAQKWIEAFERGGEDQ